MGVYRYKKRTSAFWEEKRADEINPDINKGKQWYQFASISSEQDGTMTQYGTLMDIYDNDYNTYIGFEASGVLSENHAYVIINLNKLYVIANIQAKVYLAGDAAGLDTRGHAGLQYSLDGETYYDIEDTYYNGIAGLTTEVQGNNITAQYIRIHLWRENTGNNSVSVSRLIELKINI